MSTQMKTPKMTEAYLKRIDAVGAHFKFLDMSNRMNQVISSGAQGKRSSNLMVY